MFSVLIHVVPFTVQHSFLCQLIFQHMHSLHFVHPLISEWAFGILKIDLFICVPGLSCSMLWQADCQLQHVEASSPTRDGHEPPCIGSTEFLVSIPPGMSPFGDFQPLAFVNNSATEHQFKICVCVCEQFFHLLFLENCQYFQTGCPTFILKNIFFQMCKESACNAGIQETQVQFLCRENPLRRRTWQPLNVPGKLHGQRGACWAIQSMSSQSWTQLVLTQHIYLR